MSGSLNKVMILGNLGRDPEVRRTNNGQAVANLNIATSERWKDRQTGEQQEKTEWHKVVLWGPTAEVAEKYLNKGDTVFVEGRLETRKWQDNTGQDRYTTEIRADSMQMLGRRSGGGAQVGGQGGGQDRDFDQSPKTDAYDQSTKMAPKKISDDAPFDDEIPF